MRVRLPTLRHSSARSKGDTWKRTQSPCQKDCLKKKSQSMWMEPIAVCLKLVHLMLLFEQRAPLLKICSCCIPHRLWMSWLLGNLNKDFGDLWDQEVLLTNYEWLCELAKCWSPQYMEIISLRELFGSRLASEDGILPGVTTRCHCAIWLDHKHCCFIELRRHQM